MTCYWLNHAPTFYRVSVLIGLRELSCTCIVTSRSGCQQSKYDDVADLSRATCHVYGRKFDIKNLRLGCSVPVVHTKSRTALNQIPLSLPVWQNVILKISCVIHTATVVCCTCDSSIGSCTLEFQISAYRRVFILIFLPAYTHLIWVYALN